MADLVTQVQEALAHAGALHAIATSAINDAGMTAAEASATSAEADATYSRAESRAKVIYDKAVEKAHETLERAKVEAAAQVKAKQDKADEAREALVAYQASVHESLGVDINLAGAAVSGSHTRL